MQANLNFNGEEHQYVTPQKRINDMGQLQKFQSSATCMDLAMFIVESQKAVKTTRMTETELPERLQPMFAYIEKLDQWLDEIPPIEQPMRFGNKAFRTWLDRIIQNVDEDLKAIMNAANPEFTQAERAVLEVKEYLIDSFGSYERIDYGTGHELNFYVFLYCMCKINVFNVNDYKPLINKIFQRYLILMRRL